jgi:hypothetical protein
MRNCGPSDLIIGIDGVKSWVDAGIPRAHHLGVLRGLQNRGFEPTLRVFGLMNWAKLRGGAHMTDTIGVLSMNRYGRWEIIREERVPYELSSGSFVLLEVDGVLRLTSVEYGHDDRGYYSVNGYLLAGGLRAAPPGDAENGQKLA